MVETLTAPPPEEAERQAKTRTRQAQFGDGYSQRGADGLNSVTRMLPLTWPAMEKADADAIEAFLTARGGHEAFYYQLPGDALPRLWICKEWSEPFEFGEYWSINATFEEVFDL